MGTDWMRLYRAYAIYEFRQLFRVPAFWIPTILFPAMFFLFFGAAFRPPGIGGGNFMMASWVVYAVAGVAFYQFGVGVAMDRERPWDRYLRVMPASPAPRMAARLCTSLTFALAAAILVGFVGWFTVPVKIGLGQAGALLLALLFGGAVFTLFGIALGYSLSAKAAVPIVNLVFLPLAFVGGLWIPPASMPQTIELISRFTPTRHLAEIAWSTVSESSPLPATSFVVLAAYGVGFAGLALWAFRRDWSARYR